MNWDSRLLSAALAVAIRWQQWRRNLRCTLGAVQKFSKSHINKVSFISPEIYVHRNTSTNTQSHYLFSEEKAFSGRKGEAKLLRNVHSNWIIVCHYVATTLSITCQLAQERRKLKRIKTFICMIMFALNGSWMTIWLFGWDCSGGERWLWGGKHLLRHTAMLRFFFRYMVIYLNSFCRIMLLSPRHKCESHLGSAHTIAATAMTWLFMARERCLSDVRNPWASSMIRFSIPLIDEHQQVNAHSMKSPDAEPAQFLREWFYR